MQPSPPPDPESHDPKSPGPKSPGPKSPGPESPDPESPASPSPARSSQDATIAAEILRQASACGPAASISPSDVAAALHVEWRSLLGRVRRVAIGLAREGRIDILRKGRPVPLQGAVDDAGEPASVKGVIRLRLRAEPAPQDASPHEPAPLTD